MPDFEKFTNYSQELLNSAGAVMQSHKNSELQPAHIMLAMIKGEGIIRDYLTELKLLNQILSIRFHNGKFLSDNFWSSVWSSLFVK